MPSNPRTSSIREQVFGWHKGSLEWLATQPEDAVVYTRKTVVNLDA